MITAIAMPPKPQRSPLSRFFRPAIDPQTWLKAGHLLLMFPLGTAYFVFFVTAIALGGSLIWTFPGVAILLFTMFVSRWLGDLEATQVEWVTGTHIQRPPWHLEGVTTFRERMKVRLIDPTTWTGLTYLVLQMVVGTATFSAVVTLLATAGMFTAAPLIPGMSNENVDVFGMTLDTAAEAAVLVPVGLLLFVVSAHAIGWMSNLHTRWARLMLGTRARSVAAAPVTPGDGPEPGGKAVVTPELRLVEAPETETTQAWGDPRFRDLTAREREVLLLMARGYSNAEIAEAFVLSEGTVKTHVKRVLAKVEARDRTQAAVLVYEKGLLVPAASQGAVPFDARGAGRAG